ncbi:DUF7673 family protein [Achromobacter kerstersii]|uniref:DUF7673 family protein n=1 Tax=Achromobacter kerstersii TaxID=1353890 RepID=UPI0006C45E33|nr:KorB domain-containing protein [Achromobacter kerstersii]CUJ48992.1 Transcriptional repressor protein korB [Achromobacter kerstersii]
MIDLEGLTVREIADLISVKLSRGMSQTQIAKHLGKSKTWVSQYAAMLDLPPPVADAVARGQVHDVTLINELAAAYEEDPTAVADLLQNAQKRPTRAQVKSIRAQAKPRRQSDRRRDFCADFGARQGSDLQQQGGRVQHDQLQGTNLLLRQGSMDALNRLIDIAREDTPQSKQVADFLLAWLNATNCGGFDLTDLWAVNSEVFADILMVINFIGRTRWYPTELSASISHAFDDLLCRWRPNLVASATNLGTEHRSAV